MNSDKTPKKRDRSRKKMQTQLPFDKNNYLLFGLSLAIIFIGYIFMSMRSWDRFYSLRVEPILLVLGYCLTLPLDILYKKKNK